MRRSSVIDRGEAFVAALAERDYSRLANTLAPNVRMRALLPPGTVEISGPEATSAKFSSWFGGAEDLELVSSGSEAIADRLHVYYRLRVRKPGDVWKLVEQHLLCALDGDQIAALDLICSGFRPDPRPTA
jgi:SnoaL-like protein